MINRNGALTLATLLLICGMLGSTVSCSGNEKKARNVIQEYLKNQGVVDLVVDLFYTDPNIPDKAYASATATYNFAGADGKPKREFLGFIMARDAGGWRIERNASYTKEQQRAATFLTGGK